MNRKTSMLDTEQKEAQQETGSETSQIVPAKPDGHLKVS